MRKIILAFMVGMAFMLSATAQTRTVSGKVLDEKGNPPEGISVLVQGTNNGASTSANGTFSISAERSGTLIFSGVNFERLTMRATSDNPTVVLRSKNNPLEE